MSIHPFPPSPIAVELAAAHERIEELTGVINSLLGLIVMVSDRDDVSAELREIFNSNHRVEAAHDALADQVAA